MLQERLRCSSVGVRPWCMIVVVGGVSCRRSNYIVIARGAKTSLINIATIEIVALNQALKANAGRRIMQWDIQAYPSYFFHNNVVLIGLE